MAPNEDSATQHAMVTRDPPPGVRVLPGSTPVVSFGDVTRARVATLGINPSLKEFLDDSGNWLAQARLTTLADLGISSLAEATPDHAARVIEGCATYFDRNPYWRWFRPLNRLLTDGVGATYQDGSACHLDLVQWATNPVWSHLSRAERETLLAEDLPHLRRQLSTLNIRLVLLNGRQVLDHVTATGLVDLSETGTMAYHANRSTRLYEGDRDGIRFLGWSVNIQSGRGANTQWFRKRLVAWITTRVTLAEKRTPHALELTSKEDVRVVLNDWIQNTTKPTIGDVSSFGRRPWLSLTLDDVHIVLNADTTREAVEAFLTTDPHQPWYVIPNRNGVINKVTFRPDARPVAGWYCYTITPMPAPRTL